MQVNETQTRQIRITVSDGTKQWTLPVVEHYREAIQVIAEACLSGFSVVLVETNR